MGEEETTRVGENEGEQIKRHFMLFFIISRARAKESERIFCTRDAAHSHRVEFPVRKVKERFFGKWHIRQAAFSIPSQAF